MNIFQNLDIFSVGIVVASTGILAFIAYFDNKKSISNKAFFIFSLVTILWTIINYLSYQATKPNQILALLRSEIFLAVWLVYSLYFLISVFPKESIAIPKSNKILVFPTIIVSIINLTPLVFQKITSLTSEGHVSTVQNGPGIIIFGVTVITLIGASLVKLYKKVTTSEGIEKKQLRSILTGFGLMFTLIIIFNFIFPAFLNNPRYIALGGVFIFPFILATSYAIFKHRLLNIKVLSTEILTFVLAVAMLFEIIISNNLITLAFRFSIFLLILGVGILLIKSVRNEVKQREQLQALTAQLEDANVKLKALDQARAEFISIASHQLRTPPATIKWYLSAIISGDYGQLPDEVKTALVKTERVNNALISLIEDILNVSRIERGKMEFLFEEVQMDAMAELTYETLIPMSKEKKLNLEFHKPETPLPKIMADREKVRQVMNNLIDNALKYTKQGSVVASIFQEGGNIRFQVKDTGKGVGPEEAKSIFQKFSRGKESIKQSAGLGLGLYVAKAIIEQHKGNIWVESEGEGKGSTFIFTIPIKNDLKRTTLLDLAEVK